MYNSIKCNICYQIYKLKHDCPSCKRSCEKIGEHQCECGEKCGKPEHSCYEKMCQCCKEIVPNLESHQCYVQSVKLKDGLNKKGEVAHQMAIYDFECAQDNPKAQHIPVLIHLEIENENPLKFYDIDSFCEYLFSIKTKTKAIAHNSRGCSLYIRMDVKMRIKTEKDYLSI